MAGPLRHRWVLYFIVNSIEINHAFYLSSLETVTSRHFADMEYERLIFI